MGGGGKLPCPLSPIRPPLGQQSAVNMYYIMLLNCLHCCKISLDLCCEFNYERVNHALLFTDPPKNVRGEIKFGHQREEYLVWTCGFEKNWCGLPNKNLIRILHNSRDRRRPTSTGGAKGSRKTYQKLFDKFKET